MIADILAQVSSDVMTPTGFLFVANGALSVAIGKIYADCRKDRDKLWQHIRDLERRLQD